MIKIIAIIFELQWRVVNLAYKIERLNCATQLLIALKKTILVLA